MRRTKTKTTKLKINEKLKPSRQEKKIMDYLFKFRFINTNQFQKLLNHKNPTRIQQRLKKLKDKKYIATDNKRNENFTENTTYFVYYLGLKGRKYLKGEGFDLTVLDKVYKEKTILPPFREYCMVLVDMYIFFVSQKAENETLKFYTQNNLVGYNYLPQEPEPIDAYISLETKNKTRRFFLKIFNEGDPTWLYQQMIKKYITYCEDGIWEENTNKTPFPTILFVCPNDNKKYYVYKYGGALLKKAITINMQLFVTSQQTIKSGTKNFWMEAK